MNMNDLLLQKAKQDQLAHFYILETHLNEEESAKKLFDFVSGFLKKYYIEIENQKNFPRHIQDHPDILILGKTLESDEKQSSFFTVEEAAALNRFFEFRALQSKRKFAIIMDGHRISPVVANKWLKLLEEPFGNSTIFLLNPRGQKLLDTIHSRALHLRLSSPKTQTDLVELLNFISDVKKKSLHQFLEEYSKADKELVYWNNLLIEWESTQLDQAEAKNALIDWLSKSQEMDIFHQPTATKWTLFYSFLGKYVLPRFP
jgi:hypothetical protein